MKVFYAGDLHGVLDGYKRIDHYCRDHSISLVVQLGDSGILWNPNDCPIVDYFNNDFSLSRGIDGEVIREDGPVWITIGGNHDNWPAWRELPKRKVFLTRPNQTFLLEPVELTVLANSLYFADRSTVAIIAATTHVFFGGATSIDRYHRIWGHSMWREAEEPTVAEWNRFASTMEELAPPIICTHECPSIVSLYREARDSDPIVKALQAVLEGTRTEHPMWNPLWMYGHHHNLDKKVLSEGTFLNCGIDGQGFVVDYNKLNDEPITAVGKKPSGSKTWKM